MEEAPILQNKQDPFISSDKTVRNSKWIIIIALIFGVLIGCVFMYLYQTEFSLVQYTPTPTVSIETTINPTQVQLNLTPTPMVTLAPDPRYTLAAPSTTIINKPLSKEQISYIYQDEVWVSDFDGSNKTQITQSTQPVSLFAWDNDGKTLYLSFRIDTINNEFIGFINHGVLKIDTNNKDSQFIIDPITDKRFLYPGSCMYIYYPSVSFIKVDPNSNNILISKQGLIVYNNLNQKLETIVQLPTFFNVNEVTISNNSNSKQQVNAACATEERYSNISWGTDSNIVLAEIIGWEWGKQELINLTTKEKVYEVINTLGMGTELNFYPYTIIDSSNLFGVIYTENGTNHYQYTIKNIYEDTLNSFMSSNQYFNNFVFDNNRNYLYFITPSGTFSSTGVFASVPELDRSSLYRYNLSELSEPRNRLELIGKINNTNDATTYNLELDFAQNLLIKINNSNEYSKSTLLGVDINSKVISNISETVRGFGFKPPSNSN